MPMLIVTVSRIDVIDVVKHEWDISNITTLS